MQPDEVAEPTEGSPSAFIRLLVQITTILHFIESVGATIIFWLIPSLTPEPRIYHYVSRSPSTTNTSSINSAHHHRLHHHHRIIHGQSLHNSGVDESPTDRVATVPENSDPMLEYLKDVDRAIKRREHILSSTERENGGRRQKRIGKIISKFLDVKDTISTPWMTSRTRTFSIQV